MVVAIDDDQILETTGDEEFAIPQETEITGAQKRAVSDRLT